MKTGILARKLGLAINDGALDEIDPAAFIADQLAQPKDRRSAISYREPPVQLEPWPSEMTYSLDERIEKMVAHEKTITQIRNSNLSDEEFDAQIEDAQKTYYVERVDTYRFFNAALYATDHVRQRLMHFWLNHFTVGGSRQLVGDYWENAIYAFLDGSFSDLLYSVTTHPAMLSYLDNVYNVGEGSEHAIGCAGGKCFSGLNDNLARELMELHTVSPARGYTETDIHQAAKVLAGWGSPFVFPFKNKPLSYYEPYEPFRAEPGEKTVLGKLISEGPSGLRELTNHLSSDPLTADHLSRKLLLHFAGEPVREEDVERVKKIWTETNGSLSAVHSEVLLIAATGSSKRFHWPLTWMLQVLRMSDAHLVPGAREMDMDFRVGGITQADDLMWEMGLTFWEDRQPNGYSDYKVDWVSTEHLDRRIRFASLVFQYGMPQISVEEIIEMQGLSKATIDTVSQGQSDHQKFVLLMCSPEIMEV